MGSASQRLVAAFAPPEQQRGFFVAVCWRSALGIALLALGALAVALWVGDSQALATVLAASALSGAVASVAVARLLHGHRFALRYGIAGLAALAGGGVALYLVEVPAAPFVAAIAIVLLLLGLLFYRAEEVARRRGVDEPGRAALELWLAPLIAIPRWLVAAVRRDD
ncbi:MAG: hypothetical protein JXR83_16035 [Deltaproteobacteria bacterium]|nr:hypothetical protein [Deltaproteobacteria bacterium]